MNRSRVIALSVLLFVATPCVAGPGRPTKAPPQLGLAETGIREAAGGIVITVFKSVRETRTRLVEQTVDGKLVRKTETYTVSKGVPERRFINAGYFRVSRDGQWLDANTQAELLKQATPVVISDSEDLLDAFYLGFFKPGTLVVHGRPAPPEPIRARVKAPAARAAPVPPVVP